MQWFVSQCSFSSASFLEFVSVPWALLVPSGLPGSVWLVGSVQQCRALLSACFFFSPNAVISCFDHSFQIQAPRVEYLRAAARRTWSREKKHGRKIRHCLLWKEICFIFFPMLCPVLRQALAQVQTNCHGESVLEVISCICDYAERDVRKGLSSK